jgi:transcriptional regulator with XRE-family HTH domain
MNNNVLIEIGKRINKARTNLGLTYEEAAERADSTKQTISLAEKGKQELKAINIIKIANGLGVSTDFLLKGLPSDSDLEFFDKRIRNLNKEQYEFLSELIRKFIDLCEFT